MDKETGNHTTTLCMERRVGMSTVASRTWQTALSVAGLLIAITGFARAQEPQTVEEGPVHEALVPPVTGVTAIEAIETAPPALVTERVPEHQDPQAIWIPGYWAWEPEREDFLWVTGVWRRPPPGRHWVGGYWKQYDEGWVWARGFWSQVPEDQLTHVGIAPPDPPDDDVPTPPTDNYFWLGGHWDFSVERSGFRWLYGHWERLDSNWVCVPGQWLWRPDSYVFVSAYWDWPFDLRGRWYGCVYVEPVARVNCVYEPVTIVEPLFVFRRLYWYYPDYVYFLYHHHHFHLGWWHDYFDVPPWWGWRSWWSFPWHHHWHLWWWYTHPGYRHPHWMTASLASRIHPPHKKLLADAKKIKPPNIVTPDGVVTPRKKLDEALKEKPKPSPGKPDHRAPIYSPVRKEADKLAAKPAEAGVGKPLLPTGKKVAERPYEPKGKEPPPSKPRVRLPSDEPKTPKATSKEVTPFTEPKAKVEEKAKAKRDARPSEPKITPKTEPKRTIPKAPKAAEPRPKSEPTRDRTPKDGLGRKPTGSARQPTAPSSPRTPSPGPKSKSKGSPGFSGAETDSSDSPVRKPPETSPETQVRCY
jgi:hypothetical protein